MITLSGKGGAGKTHELRNLIDIFNRNYYDVYYEDKGIFHAWTNYPHKTNFKKDCLAIVYLPLQNIICGINTKGDSPSDVQYGINTLLSQLKVHKANKVITESPCDIIVVATHNKGGANSGFYTAQTLADNYRYQFIPIIKLNEHNPAVNLPMDFANFLFELITN